MGLLYSLYLTRTATKAATRAVAVTSETAERQLRAYILCHKGRLIGDETDDPRARIKIVNSGVTPAYKVRITAHLTIGTPGEFRFLETEPFFALSDLAPGRSRTAIIPADDATMFPSYQDDLVAGRMVIYLYGRVRYSDCFGEVRTTRFRAEINKRWGAGEGRFAVSDEGNEAD